MAPPQIGTLGLGVRPRRIGTANARCNGSWDPGPLEGVETVVGFNAEVRRAWADHHERLWRALLGWSGDQEVASEAVAEAFAQVLRRGDGVEDIARWVWRSAFRIAAGMLADRSTQVGLEDLLVGTADGDTEVGEVTALLACLREIGDLDRKIVVLALVGGWSAPEIGRFTGSTAGAVRVRLHRARRRLQRLLEADHD
jgi:DNA-directed RNA polymerase specialized sigma24 family protein